MEHWYLLSEPRFAEFLARSAAGENPDLVYCEMYVSSDHEYHGENPDWRGGR